MGFDQFKSNRMPEELGGRDPIPRRPSIEKTRSSVEEPRHFDKKENDLPRTAGHPSLRTNARRMYFVIDILTTEY
jgi:hypothetical protein